MKHNTQEIKNLLNQALSGFPSDHALAGARSYIAEAVRQIENVEKKRFRREVTAQQQAPAVQSVNPLRALELLDEMLDEEKKKLESLKRPKQQSQGASFTLFD